MNGTQVVNRYLCLNQHFRESFEKSLHCYRSLHEEIIDCEGPEDWYESQNGSHVCDAMSQILTCNYQKIAQLCGLKAAHFFHLLSREIFFGVLQKSCDLAGEPNVPAALVASDGCSHEGFLILNSFVTVGIAWILAK